jgi:multidrug resistance efflux pump
MEELKHESAKSAMSENGMELRGKRVKGKFRVSKKTLLSVSVLILVLAAAGAGARFYIDYAGQWISTNNAFVEGRIYTVSSQIPGHIDKIHVAEGARIAKGTLLVAVDSTLQNLAVRKIEAAIRTNARMMEISEHLLPHADPELEMARARRDELNIMLEEARFVYEQTRIFSPSDGYIAHMLAEEGEYVLPGQALMSVVNLDDLWITANFLEEQVRYLRVGQKVDIYVDADPNYPLHGRVESIMPAGGAAFALFPPDATGAAWVRVPQRIPVKIVFEEDENRKHLRLRIGMLAEVRVER